ncbi:MAG: O-antigen ligase family protein [Bryobacteraceae bacterium]|nr:O-antigen ligase family protein [Bryobacteraceae bacterium]
MKAADRVAFALLALLVFSIPWEKSLVAPGIGTVSRVLGSIALVGGVVAATLRRQVRLPNFALTLAGVFVLWSAATWFWSYYPEATVARSLTLLQLFLMAWLVWDLCRSAWQQRVLVGAFVLGAAVASLGTFARYAMSQQTYYKRYAAAGFDPNDLGLTVALAIPLALWLALRPGRMAWLWRVLVVVCCGAVLLTASRTAMVCAMAAFAVVPLAWRESTPQARWSGVGLLLLLIAGAVGLAPKESRQRLATIRTEVTTGTLHNRTTIWKAGVQAWKLRRLTGVGAGAYPKAVEPLIGVPGVAGHEYVAHNTFLSVLVETGVIGFVLFSAFVGVLLVFALIQRAPERALWLTVMLVWAIGVSTLTWEHRKAAWVLFALLMTGWSRAFRAETA